MIGSALLLNIEHIYITLDFQVIWPCVSIPVWTMNTSQDPFFHLWTAPIQILLHRNARKLGQKIAHGIKVQFPSLPHIIANI